MSRPYYAAFDAPEVITRIIAQVICNFYGNKGHIEKACITKQKSGGRKIPNQGRNQIGPQRKEVSSQRAKVHRIEEHKNLTSNPVEEYTSLFKIRGSKIPPLKILINIENIPVMMEIDSGAGYTVVSEQTLKEIKIQRDQLEPEEVKLQTWADQNLEVVGTTMVSVQFKGRVMNLSLLVIKGNGPGLVGRNWFEPLGIRIEGLYHQHDPVRTSKWPTSVVPVAKPDGSVRLCGDYRCTVNREAIKVDVYPLPAINDILASLSGGKVFAKLDFKEAYFQFPVDQESSEILTINTCKGLYRMKRLPFGVSSCPAICQREMEKIVGGITGTIVMIDDILVMGLNEEALHQKLRKILNRISEAGLKLNKSKCLFKTNQLQFLGYLIDAQGIRPTPDKIAAIQQVQDLRNKQELQAFLGFVNFYDRFLKDKATEAEPLYRLLDKNKPWIWKKEQSKAFVKIKKMLTPETLLIHYDLNKPVLLSCDASPYGVGAVLSHILPDGSEAPIYFASRTLHPAERNYSQFEREVLAIIFGITKFHNYLAARNFTIYTDCKPVVGLLNPAKPIPDLISPRMIRWCLRLAAYSYRIEHRRSAEMTNVDALSRIPTTVEEKTIPEPGEIFLIFEQPELPITSQEVSRETNKDSVLKRVEHAILHGWPLSSPEELMPFARRKLELSIHRGCILWGQRVVIPRTLQPQLLHLLHSTHEGMSRMKRTARSYFWWPEMDSQIEETVSMCRKCQEQRSNPTPVKDTHWPSPSGPWDRVHIDHAGPHYGRTYFILVDAYSKWVEVEEVQTQSTQETVKLLRRIFSTHGLPNTIVSDNHQSFKSQEMEEFIRKNGIQHIFTPPYHPSSNGQVERQVQTIKKRIEKLHHSQEKSEVLLPRLLFSLRTTPSSTTGKTAAELLMGRRLRTVYDRLNPHLYKERKEETRIREFQIGDNINYRCYRDAKKWKPGKVTQKTGPYTYMIASPEGTIERRHIDQLIARRELPLQNKQHPVCQNNQHPAPQNNQHQDKGPPVRRSSRTQTLPAYLRDFILEEEDLL
ncbi:uncharacterized protein K02A2.6-like [Centruroides sculpturatus]|uniref:uncharacterized protein K02A2.6-like n=1 Tax=Centruroides sculpturatus TaxID=218467 RepID=UPI000C6D3F65|nr:uncharacterized protein K02A2.6-like [Centruroides sculpturatus]